VAIFQHSLPFLQSESFQTHGTIHRRAIGPLAHHNSTSAYSPSLTCHLPAPTIECLRRPRYKLTCSSHNFPIRTQSSNQKESTARHTSMSVLERSPKHTRLVRFQNTSSLEQIPTHTLPISVEVPNTTIP
jgi:hypothetical protein